MLENQEGEKNNVFFFSQLNLKIVFVQKKKCLGFCSRPAPRFVFCSEYDSFLQDRSSSPAQAFSIFNSICQTFVL